MTRFLESSPVLQTRKVADNTFITRFHSPKIAPLVKAGQFVMVSFPGVLDPLLPRAFSVCDADKEYVDLFYVAVGKGTTRLSHLVVGDVVTLNGPLGNGFPDLSGGERVWIAIGGSGAALLPILTRSAKKSGAELTIFYGARTKSQFVYFSDDKNHLSTDDGSEGYHGTVVELLKKELSKQKPDKVYACGPTPMLAAIQQEFGNMIPTYLSVETPMACGMGFCQGCPVKKVGEPDYYLACKDGPVFRSNEIEFIRENSAK